MAKKPRDYKREYELYQGTPEQLRNQSLRHKARRAYEKEHGTLPDSVDVHHKKALSKGGDAVKLSNLKAASRSANRSFARTSSNKLKSETSRRERSR